MNGAFMTYRQDRRWIVRSLAMVGGAWLVLGSMACSSDDPKPVPTSEVGPDADASRDGASDVAVVREVGGSDAPEAGDARRRPSVAEIAALLPDSGPQGLVCVGCLADKCSTQIDACIDDQACVQGVACVAARCAGTEGATQLACVTACGNPTVLLRVLGIFTCGGASCSSSCSPPDGGVTPVPPDAPIPSEGGADVGNDTGSTTDAGAADVTPVDAVVATDVAPTDTAPEADASAD